MRHITFIGLLDSTFASRWKKEKFPELITEGKKLSKEIASNKNPDIKTLRKLADRRNKLKEAGLFAKTNLYEVTDHINRHGKGFNKDYYLDPVRGDRINKLADNIMEKRGIQKPQQKITPQPEAIYTPRDGEEVLRQTKSLPPSNVSNNTSTKSLSNPSPKVNSKSATPLLQAKKLPLGKIGLGAVGLATVGAVGYGLLRKTRNDKGKRRGSYRK